MKSCRIPLSTAVASSPIVPLLLVTLTACSDPFATERRPQFAGSAPFPASLEEMTGTPDKTLHPPVVNPVYLTAAQAEGFLEEDDIVFVIREEHQTRVYPEVILGPHHVVNEELDGKAVAVTYCMLADSAILYSRESGGEPSFLGALGTFYHGNLVMYDFSTDSYWLQLRGECFHGERRGERLEALDIVERLTWGDARRLPRPRVLAPEDHIRPYREFLDELKSGELGLQVLEARAEPDRRLPAYTRGLGVTVHGQARFFPLEGVRRQGLVQDVVGGWSLLLVNEPDSGAVRMFRRFLDGRRLAFGRANEAIVDEETGSRWSARGVCLEGPLAGKRLERPACTQVYWYSWAAFYPGTSYCSIEAAHPTNGAAGVATQAPPVPAARKSDSGHVVEEAVASLRAVDWDALQVSRRDGPPPSGWRTLVEAEWTLVKAGEKAIPGLLQALDDPEPQVRRLAAHSLGRIGEQSEVPALAAALADEAELSVRLSIASSLGLLGGSGSEQALRGVLALEPVPGGFHDVRREVEDSLRYARKVDRTRLKHEYEIATAELIDSVAIGKPVPDLSVLRADGAEVRLSELWSEENLVLVFLFAEFCMYCKGQVDDLASHAEKMHGAGARVAMVVPQVPERVRPWKERTGSATTFLCDPAGRLQALFGVAHQIHLHEQWFPSPSCAIVDREGILRFFYRGKSYNDRFNASRVIEALERLH